MGKTYDQQLREIESLKLKDLHVQMKKLRRKGLQPHIKGRGCGRIKLEFE